MVHCAGTLVVMPAFKASECHRSRGAPSDDLLAHRAGELFNLCRSRRISTRPIWPLGASPPLAGRSCPRPALDAHRRKAAKSETAQNCMVRPKPDLTACGFRRAGRCPRGDSGHSPRRSCLRSTRLRERKRVGLGRVLRRHSGYGHGRRRGAPREARRNLHWRRHGSRRAISTIPKPLSASSAPDIGSPAI